MKVLFVIIGLITYGSCESTGPLSRIIGGIEADTGSAPFIVALHYNNRSDYLLFCAATIITPIWLLTAAHCLDEVRPSTVDLVAGTNNKNGTGEGAQKRIAARFVIHPGYSMEIKNDIAMIQPSAAFVYTTYVSNAQLPNITNLITFGQIAYVWGWGSTSYTTNSTQPSRLRVGAVYILNLVDCMRINTPTPTFPYNICSYPGKQNPCVGDSGGPLTQFKNSNGISKETIEGIVSYGYLPCGKPNKPAVYTSVVFFEFWIKSIIRPS